ncbi:MAG TPA: hypothetical protein PK807_08985, partial [Verrucomicrobiota bacterium]|nr:hypothetical protein [Verrucomicrobiota bacterium]
NTLSGNHDDQFAELDGHNWLRLGGRVGGEALFPGSTSQWGVPACWSPLTTVAGRTSLER